ncbi:Orb6 [Acrasis kona]|uniref:Orb6 n=1 Tax=Acrasis kona TaxID=1008807 RepID=A0AAW2ZSE8_9EUKA
MDPISPASNNNYENGEVHAKLDNSILDQYPTPPLNDINDTPKEPIQEVSLSIDLFIKEKTSIIDYGYSYLNFVLTICSESSNKYKDAASIVAQPKSLSFYKCHSLYILITHQKSSKRKMIN